MATERRVWARKAERRGDVVGGRRRGWSGGEARRRERSAWREGVRGREGGRRDLRMWRMWGGHWGGDGAGGVGVVARSWGKREREVGVR